jgi:hypothetical protein
MDNHSRLEQNPRTLVFFTNNFVYYLIEIELIQPHQTEQLNEKSQVPALSSILINPTTSSSIATNEADSNDQRVLNKAIQKQQPTWRHQQTL